MEELISSKFSVPALNLKRFSASPVNVKTVPALFLNEPAPCGLFVNALLTAERPARGPYEDAVRGMTFFATVAPALT